MGTPEVKRPKQLEDENRRLKQMVAGERPVGAPRMAVMIRREFGVVNHKRVERLHTEQGLQLPRRPKRRRRGVQRVVPAEMPTAPGQRGSMDFVHDVLAATGPGLRQRHRVHVSRHADVVTAHRYNASLHPTRQGDSECLLRIVQRQTAHRVPADRKSVV